MNYLISDFITNCNPDKKIPRASLATMLKNLFYTGWYQYPGCEEEIKGQYKAIISRGLYDKVQENLNISGYEKIRKHDFLYSKLLTLQETGKFMTGEIKKGKYIYYTAFDKDKNRHSVNETVVTEAILNYFKEIRLNLITKDIVNEVIKEELKPLKLKYSKLKRLVSHDYHKKLQLDKYIRTNKIEDEDFIYESLSDIENAYQNLPEQIAKAEEEIKIQTEKCENILQKRLYDAYIQLEPAKQKDVLELVKNKLELQDKKVKLTFKSAFRKIRKR